MRPIIIIGAARSGTNMLRDILTSLSNYSSWDCDEINPIWKHHNISYPFDDMPKEMASPKVKRFIISQFGKISHKTGAEFIVEKTCANSLRLPFVFSVFPDAKYIIMLRDGFDVSVSAMKRWKSTPDLTYTLKKAKYVPVLDVPHYGFNFVKNRTLQVLNKNKKMNTWGPRFKGIDLAVQTNNLLSLCALQWYQSVSKVLEFIPSIPAEQLQIVKYENFVTEPISELSKILSFLNVDLGIEKKRELVINVSNKSIGSAKKQLSDYEITKVDKILSPLVAVINNVV